MKIEILPATGRLAAGYYGDAPIPTMRAYFLVVDSEMIATAGFVRLGKGRQLAVSESKPGATKKYKKAIVKFARAMMKLADDNKWILTANADDSIPTAVEFLRRMGFVESEDGSFERWPQ